MGRGELVMGADSTEGASGEAIVFAGVQPGVALQTVFTLRKATSDAVRRTESAGREMRGGQGRMEQEQEQEQTVDMDA